MAFDDVRLPEDIERGSQGGPEFRTVVLTADNGDEWTNSKWKYPRIIWNASYGVDSKAKFQAIVAFFIARRGKSRKFRFKDWSDYTALNSVVGIGDGVRKDFQLIKLYPGPVPLERRILLPIPSTLKVYANGVPTQAFSVNPTTGVLTLNPAPALGVTISASFEFDVRVRFDMDMLPVNMIWEGAASIPTITIREVTNDAN